MTRVLVTRPADAAGGVVARLGEAGLEAVCLPLIQTRPLADTRHLDDALAHLAGYDWVVFASASAARLFAGRARALGVRPPESASLRLCAGPATATALAALGWTVDLVVSPFTAERAAEALLPLVGAGTRLLIPRAEAGRDVVGRALREQGAEVDEVVLYQTVADPERAWEAARRISGGELGAVLFFSPSAVDALRDAAGAVAGGPGGAGALLDGVAVACIGPTTARAVQEAGWGVDVVASDTTGGALVDALVDHLAHRDQVRGPKSKVRSSQPADSPASAQLRCSVQLPRGLR
jgi:uroporphyrinogen-III synthase